MEVIEVKADLFKALETTNKSTNLLFQFESKFTEFTRGNSFYADMLIVLVGAGMEVIETEAEPFMAQHLQTIVTDSKHSQSMYLEAVWFGAMYLRIIYEAIKLWVVLFIAV